MKQAPLLLALAAALLAAPAGAAQLEDFSGYKNGDGFIPGITLAPGGTGWLDGWRSSNSFVEVTGSIIKTKPVDSGQYLDVQLISVAGQHPSKPSGAVTIPYRTPDRPFKLSFKFRPNVPDDNFRYFLCDLDARHAGTSGVASWQIDSLDGVWNLTDGEHDGLETRQLPTAMPVVAGTTYTFTLMIDPARRVWSVTITDGKRTVTHKDLHFRTDRVTPERCLLFGASELFPNAVGITAHFSLDSISIQP
ncbi:MAG TPA: hypothetical protein VK985_08545 [Rariglobus sp.]|nr:hypothetical protein [Rariglobus sp.]